MSPPPLPQPVTQPALPPFAPPPTPVSSPSPVTPCSSSAAAAAATSRCLFLLQQKQLISSPVIRTATFQSPQKKRSLPLDDIANDSAPERQAQQQQHQDGNHDRDNKGDGCNVADGSHKRQRRVALVDEKKLGNLLSQLRTNKFIGTFDPQHHAKHMIGQNARLQRQQVSAKREDNVRPSLSASFTRRTSYCNCNLHPFLHHQHMTSKSTSSFRESLLLGINKRKLSTVAFVTTTQAITSSTTTTANIPCCSFASDISDLTAGTDSQ